MTRDRTLLLPRHDAEERAFATGSATYKANP